MRALLIIDMQKVSFTPATPRYDADGVTERINRLSDLFRAKGDLVIFIRHDGSSEGFCIPGTEEWEILDSLNLNAGDLIISKTANDSFYRTTLQDDLQRSGIDELVITGCATDFCVDATVKSALTNDYRVIVIADAHTTSDRPNLKAKQVIGHYNWMWTEMVPVPNKIIVTQFDDFVKELTKPKHNAYPL
jgi:nicotinamidase-related amidase